MHCSVVSENKVKINIKTICRVILNKYINKNTYNLCTMLPTFVYTTMSTIFYVKNTIILQSLV